MASFGFLGARPRLAVVGAVALMAFALLVIPVSYQRVVGHDVTLTLAGADLNRDTVGGIATEFKAAVGGEPVRIEAQSHGGVPEYVFSSRVPGRAGHSAKKVSEVFAHSLAAKGYHAQAAVTPVKEKVSSNVYAMVAENVILITVDGKSAEELEAAITAQLAAAGIPDAEVSVTLDEDGNRMEVQVRAEVEAPADGSAPPQTDLVLTVGGEELDGEVSNVRVKVHKTVTDGLANLIVDIERADRTATVTVSDPESLSDAELIAEIQRQLAAQGITDLSVSVTDGRVEILDAAALLQKSAPGASPAQEKASWGKVKSKYGSSN